MKATAYRLVPYDVPLSEPYRWARGVNTRRRGLLIMVQADDGTQGWGEMAPPPDDPASAQEMHDEARRVLDRLDAGEDGDLLDHLDRLGPGPRLRAAVAAAWFDVRARSNGRSLADELASSLGVARTPAERVPVNALIGAHPARVAAAQAVDRVAEGFTTLKLKSDGDVRRDVQRLTAIRDAVGDGVDLRLDANASWETASVLQHLRAVARFRLEYVEQPVANRSLAAAASLRAKSPVPIALDESVVDERAAQEILMRGAADVLILKPQRLGGPDRTVRIIQHAAQAGVPCVVTNSLETGIGRAAALEAASLLPTPMRPCGLATEGFLSKDTVAHPPRARDGWIRRDGGPGLGVTPDVAPAEPVPLGGP